MGNDVSQGCLLLSTYLTSLSPPPYWSSSFILCEHWCLLQLMNASSFAHCLGFDTLKLPQAKKTKWKRILKIAFGPGFFFLVAPLSPSSFTSLFPSSHLHSSINVKERDGVIDDDSADLCNFRMHTYTYFFSSQDSFCFCFLSSGFSLNDVVPGPEWGQESNGETYWAVKAVCKWPINNKRPRISRCNIVPRSVCVFCVENRWCYWLPY